MHAGASAPPALPLASGLSAAGMDSLVYRHGGGRPEKLTPTQRKRLVALIEAGPLVVGLETACWNSVLIRVLIWRELAYSLRHYVCIHTLGFSFQKARFVSDHLDAAKRLVWLQDQWPAIVRAAKRCKGLILFEDEASFAQWGSLSYTWAHRGHQPEVPTRGKRKGYKVFGAIEYFSGRLFSQVNVLGASPYASVLPPVSRKNVRFDGNHKRDAFLVEVFGRHVAWVPVCPEVEMGLGVPRETMRLERHGHEIRLVTPKTGADHTERLQTFAAQRLAALSQERLCGYILKKDSPSCGMERVRPIPTTRSRTAQGRGCLRRR